MYTVILNHITKKHTNKIKPQANIEGRNTFNFFLSFPRQKWQHSAWYRSKQFYQCPLKNNVEYQSIFDWTCPMNLRYNIFAVFWLCKIASITDWVYLNNTKRVFLPLKYVQSGGFADSFVFLFNLCFFYLRSHFTFLLTSFFPHNSICSIYSVDKIMTWTSMNLLMFLKSVLR